MHGRLTGLPGGQAARRDGEALCIPVLHGAALDRPDEADTLATAGAIAAALERMGHAAPVLHIGARTAPPRALAALRPDLVFNMVEAVGGDAARAALVPGALDRRGYRYTGCGVRATRLCLSKPGMKRAMRAAGLPTPAWCLSGRSLAATPRVIVKSATEHASVGIDAASVTTGEQAAAEIAARMASHGGVFFAERFVEGREFNLSLLEGPQGPAVLPPAEILFVGYGPDRPRIVDYEAKWIAGNHGYDNTPRRFDFPPADAPLLEALGAIARRAWTLFGLGGYARADFRVDEAGRPWLLEVNTNPCLAPDAGFVAAAARAGLGYDALIGRIVAAAMDCRAEAA